MTYLSFPEDTAIRFRPVACKVRTRFLLPLPHGAAALHGRVRPGHTCSLGKFGHGRRQGRPTYRKRGVRGDSCRGFSVWGADTMIAFRVETVSFRSRISSLRACMSLSHLVAMWSVERLHDQQNCVRRCISDGYVCPALAQVGGEIRIRYGFKPRGGARGAGDSRPAAGPKSVGRPTKNGGSTRTP